MSPKRRVLQTAAVRFLALTDISDIFEEIPSPERIFFLFFCLLGVAFRRLVEFGVERVAPRTLF